MVELYTARILSIPCLSFFSLFFPCLSLSLETVRPVARHRRLAVKHGGSRPCFERSIQEVLFRCPNHIPVPARRAIFTACGRGTLTEGDAAEDDVVFRFVDIRKRGTQADWKRERKGAVGSRRKTCMQHTKHCESAGRPAAGQLIRTRRGAHNAIHIQPRTRATSSTYM